MQTELNRPLSRQIRYFERDRDTYGFLSHFWVAEITIDGEVWPTVEHYYQSQKSDDPAYRKAIRQASSPGMAKRYAAPPGAPRRIGRQSWFRKHGSVPRSDWHDVKLDIMRRADWAKFSQHPDLAARLIATGDRELVEDAETEPFWGVGPDGAGLNWAGRILMEIRSRLTDA